MTRPVTTVERVAVAHGYGVRISVERGHLVVADGICEERKVRRYNRATSRLERLVVIGHTGFVTLEALRWIRDVGAVFVQLDSDAALVTTTARERVSTAKDLRRAQALAADSGAGRAALIALLEMKLHRQAEVAESILGGGARLPASKKTQLSVPEAIRREAEELKNAETAADLRRVESVGARYYWQTFGGLPIHFEAGLEVPDHWHRAGPRTPRQSTGNKRPKNAVSPAHAMLNYLYAILESEATIAAYRMGFDPALGLMHADKRYRPSLASDLMEPARPAADAIVVDILKDRSLRRGEVVETRRGVCRLGSELTQELARYGPKLAEAVAPHAEMLARELLRAPDHPTPLTQRRKRATTEVLKPVDV